MRNKSFFLFLCLVLCMARIFSPVYAQSKDVVIEGTLKMYCLNVEGDCNIVSQFKETDGRNTYLAFVVELGKKVNVTPYLDEGEKEMLDEPRQSSIMILPKFKYSTRDFATKYANKRVRAKGKLYVPGGGWRNATEVVMSLKEIKLVSQSQSSYVDLGLPSGTLWKSKNESGYYDYERALKLFGNKIPSKNQMQELINKCKWTWNENGYYKVKGPNGNSIIMQADGYVSKDFNPDKSVIYKGYQGYYWSRTADVWDYSIGLFFSSSDHFVGGGANRGHGYSVRLIK